MIRFPLETLDRILSVVDRADFGAILHFRKTPPIDALRMGARSARTLFPVTDCRVESNGWYSGWTPMTSPEDGVIAAPAEAAHAAEKFFDRRFDPHVETPIRQLVVRDQCVAVRAHHAAMDAFSLGLWLGHQFRVAAGLDAPVSTTSPEEPVRLRTATPTGAPEPARTPLWTRRSEGEVTRRWRTIELPGNASTHALAAALLRTLTAWNRNHGARTEGLSLWMPVNIRRRGSTGFGNGTSRIRVEALNEAGVAAAVRRGLRHGEWSIPANPLLLRLPDVVGDPVLRAYLNRPWANMGSVVFSAVEEWAGRNDPLFDDVEKIEAIGQLHRRLPLAVNAIRHGNKMWATLTYDASRLRGEDISTLAAGLVHELGTAKSKAA